MNGKPKNHRGLCLAAFHVKHPDIDAHDKLLLTYLAQNSDHNTAPESHPGNKNISDAILFKDRATDNRLTLNIARGLIERTSRADGRGKASTYRICWEKSFYPNQAPTGEWLIEKPPTPDDGQIEPRTVGCADSVGGQEEPRTVGCADSDATAHRESHNRASVESKPRTSDPITAHPTVPAAFDLPTPHQPPTQTAHGWWEGFSQRTATIDEMLGAIVSAPQKKALYAQSLLCGDDMLLAAIREWVDKRSMPVDTLRNKWAAWLDEGAPFVTRAIAGRAAAIQKVMDDAATQAGVDRQHGEMMRAKALREKQALEREGIESAEDFMGEEQ
jgi:hypothetical protein